LRLHTHPFSVGVILSGMGGRHEFVLRENLSLRTGEYESSECRFELQFVTRD